MTPGRAAIGARALHDIYHYPADLVRMLAEDQALLECAQADAARPPDPNTVPTAIPNIRDSRRRARRQTPSLRGRSPPPPIARQSPLARHRPPS